MLASSKGWSCPKKPPHIGVGGMIRPGGFVPLRRQRDVLVAIQVVGRRRRKEGRMWRYERQEQRPRPLVIGVRAQPADGVLAIADVVLLIGRVSRSGFFDRAAPIAAQRAIADAAGRVADAVHDMQRLDFAPEAVVVFAAAEVQLADGVDHETGLVQPMAPARHAPMIRKAVVPVAEFVHVAAGRQGGARRHTDRAIGVGVREARAGRSELV